MFDSREVSWGVAILRALLSLVILVGSLVLLDLIIYLDSTTNSFDERVAAAFRDSYDYGYAQTFNVSYQEARMEAFERGYSKGYELSLHSNSFKPIARLVETRNPTYSEMKEFLAADTTDSKPYIENEYVCFDFAAELNNNADAAGIQAAYVRIRSQDWGHAVVAFQTVDRGLIFIEPQSDREVELVIGQPYPWQQVFATSPLSMSEPVLAIELIW